MSSNCEILDEQPRPLREYLGLSAGRSIWVRAASVYFTLYRWHRSLSGSPYSIDAVLWSSIDAARVVLR
ncbi:hypothetical protein PUNSTDRAFT_54470 [Punctularia strigosozonata HHB-11173 SS5]|uniref:uncharacterized protein n=1 Tax=Punctularia strigosozonata (strain HHB-11173) TaxID=741275 RepID=UPI0004417795|nr:uncharacterized protein PUNSTDRAFT_54470 [Punctularia strigosozonata HHB-11173 SS5]EIN06197.1 hypothetical protein PUNSTDRAFT_54470 [Punctularia strigosozonata HHB-11173 SS5]